MTAFFTFAPNNTLTSAQLNGNFGLAINATLSTPQTILGALTIGGLTTTGFVNSASEVNKVTLVIASGTYTVTVNDSIILINKTVAGTSAVTLPTSPAAGRTIVIKDARGDSGSNAITISGAQTIDGLSSITLGANYACVVLIFGGTQWSLV